MIDWMTVTEERFKQATEGASCFQPENSEPLRSNDRNLTNSGKSKTDAYGVTYYQIGFSIG